MNIEKVKRAIYLQKKANEQIDNYGQATSDVVDELMDITDQLTPAEQELFLQMWK